MSLMSLLQEKEKERKFNSRLLLHLLPEHLLERASEERPGKDAIDA